MWKKQQNDSLKPSKLPAPTNGSGDINSHHGDTNKKNHSNILVALVLLVSTVQLYRNGTIASYSIAKTVMDYDKDQQFARVFHRNAREADHAGVNSNNRSIVFSDANANASTTVEGRSQTPSVPVEERTNDQNNASSALDKATISGGGEHDPLWCQFSAKLRKTECCAPWEVDGDQWWLHHPDWEVSTENETSYCFAPLEHDSDKAVFLRELHHFQWFGSNCSNVEKSCEVNSGFGASTGWLVKSFWYAYKSQNRPFQIMNNGRRWLYATSDNSSWAYCKEHDTRCYYLPISPCSKEVPEGMDRNHHETGNRSTAPKSSKELFQYHWITRYLQRPRQHFRRKSFELRHSLNVSYPCLAMHVRRGDVGLGRPPFRRFAHVQEYLDKARAREGENIVLLTDAESTIREVKARHPQYNWIYLDRPRHKVGSRVIFDDHLPSGDAGSEMLAIKAEMDVASSCQKVVHGQSGFVQNMLGDMKHDGKNYTEYQVKTMISKGAAQRFKYLEFEINATKPLPI